MSRFEEDTRVEVVDRPSDQGTQLRAVLQPRWEVWGPLGGYVAAIALRALARASVFPRPVSCHVVFLSPAQFAPVELLVRSLRRGRNSEALLVEMTQAGTPVLAATGWMGQEGLAGFEHADGAMPAVPAHETLRSFREHLGDAMDDWYPIWQHLEGKPERFAEEMDPEQPAAPLWRCWMSLGEPLGTEDPVVDAARTLCWLDLLGWNCATAAHPRPWPPPYLAPNMDCSAAFHQSAPQEDWLLLDGHSPSASRGTVGCTGRIWTPDGTLLATGVATLLCRPNPLAQTSPEGSEDP